MAMIDKWPEVLKSREPGEDSFLTCSEESSNEKDQNSMNIKEDSMRNSSHTPVENTEEFYTIINSTSKSFQDDGSILILKDNGLAVNNGKEGSMTYSQQHLLNPENYTYLQPSRVIDIMQSFVSKLADAIYFDHKKDLKEYEK